MNKYKLRQLANKCLRGNFIRLYSFFRDYVTDIIYDTKITYSLNTEIGANLFYHGEFEKKELELCKKYIRNDSVVLDVGANIGLHSIYFSKLASAGMVYSFEPSRHTYRQLLKNISGIDNILPLNFAVSDSTQIADFYVADDDAYSSLKDTKRKSIRRKQKVFCYETDEFLKTFKIEWIDFIKIDVEGLEQKVLEGLQEVIGISNPVIFCEIYHGENSNADPDETVKFLIEKGYKAFVLQGDCVVEYSRHNDDFYNYLFLPSVKIS